MAGRFEGLSELEWRLFVDIMPPESDQARAGDAAYAVSQGRQYVAVSLDHRLSLVRYAAGTSAGLQRVRPIAGCSVGRPMAPWQRCRPGCWGWPRNVA